MITPINDIQEFKGTSYAMVETSSFIAAINEHARQFKFAVASSFWNLCFESGSAATGMFLHVQLCAYSAGRQLNSESFAVIETSAETAKDTPSQPLDHEIEFQKIEVNVSGRKRIITGR